MKDILVCLSGTAGDEAVLALALRLARPFNGHLNCVHAVPDARSLLRQAMSVDMLASMLPADALRTLKARAQARAESARGAVAKFCERNGLGADDASGGRLSAEFREASGDPFDEIMRRARFHDLVIIEAASRHGSATPEDELARLIVEAGRPVLLAPRDTGGKDAFKTVTVAWRSGAEAARAVTASMPLLAKADSVYVLGAAETPDAEAQCREDLDAVARHLARHGIQAAPRLVAVKGNAGDSVLSAAEELQSDLLVMGAYGHGRVRELVLGGFTQHILDGVGFPVFLFH